MVNKNSQRRHYDNPEFVEYISRARKAGIVFSKLCKMAKKTFGYEGGKSALATWWLEEGSIKEGEGEGLPRKLNRKDDLLALAEIFSKKHTDWLQLEGDFVISSDWQAPAFNADLTEKMFQIAERWKIPNLIIAGDLLNVDCLSTFDRHDPEARFKDEEAVVCRLFEHFFDSFDRVYWLLGNHEARFLRSMSFEVDLEHLAAMLLKSVKTEKLICSNYAYCEVNDEWRITHPKSYSRHGGQVPMLLTAKYSKNIIGAHGHHFGIRIGADNRFVACDIGGMFDARRVDYVMYVDSTHSKWNSGFGIIKQSENNSVGALYTFTDNPRLTDWGFWLGGEK